MKIKTRDIALIAAGFVAGAVVTGSFITSPARLAPAPASGIASTGPVLAAASGAFRFAPFTNVHWLMPTARIELPPEDFINIFASPNPLYPPTRRSVDLIDMRHQPDIRMDTLK